MSLKMLVNVDGHDNNLFSRCRCSQPVSYSSHAGGLQKQTLLITFIFLRVDFEQDVGKFPDTEVEVTLGTVTQWFLPPFKLNHKAKRKLGTTVTSD
jgi:hypothetical protein